MMKLVPLLATVALVSMQNSVSGAQLFNNELDNNLSPIADPPPPRRRLRREFVNINEAPPAHAQHAPGAALELRCSAMGHPAPVVRWEKNGEPIDFGVESNDLLPLHPSSVASVTSLLIISAPSENLEDVYTCVATSALKRKVASTTVFTLQDVDSVSEDLSQQLTPLSGAPRIVKFMTYLMQNIGSTAVLPCQAQSYSNAEVYWETEIGPVFGNPRIRVLPSGDLLINSLRFSDLNGYNCTVKNSFGSDTISTFLYPMLPSKR